METYKTFKSKNTPELVEQFITQYDDILTLVIVGNTEYSLLNCDDEKDFFFEYGKSEESKRALALITEFLNSESTEAEVSEVVETEIISEEKEVKATKGNKVALLELIASKYTEVINRNNLKNDYPYFWKELLRYNQIDYDINYINFEILCNNQK